ncbi:MAG: hypothetical protein JXR31_09910 [Prolixibacteraceae bacterium]|nr:hypothetical protein [Prolixibacteraceae bacterium]
MKLNDQKLWLFGLMLECPFGVRSANCPAGDFQNNSVTEKLDIIDSLNIEKIHILIEQHEACLERRENLMIQNFPNQIKNDQTTVP